LNTTVHGISRQKKDRRLLVLFLFGLLLFIFDLFSCIGIRPDQQRNSCLLNEYAGAGEESLVKQKVNPGPKTAFFFNQPMPINQASRQDLTLLPGIGDQRAERIISFRLRNNGIHNGSELKQIPGIGRKIQRKICAFVTFE